MSKGRQMGYGQTDKFVPNPWNPNHITDPAVEARLLESVKRLSMFKPIVVRELPSGELEILGGEHRWHIAKRAGMAKIPFINLGPIVDRRAKEIALVDNTRYGDDDFGQLAKIVKELGDDLLTFMPLDETDMQSMLNATASAAAEIDLDDLDTDSSNSQSLEDMVASRAAPTGQVMRFKVPVEDAAWITQLIDNEKRAGNFKDEDALSNAGNALVSLLQRLRGGAK